MTFMALQFWIFENDDVTCKRSIWIRTLTRAIANFGKEWQPRDEVAPQALMGLFGGRQVKTNMAEFSAECQGFDRTKDSNKIEVIVLDDQKSRELRRISTTCSAVYLDPIFRVQSFFFLGAINQAKHRRNNINAWHRLFWRNRT